MHIASIKLDSLNCLALFSANIFSISGHGGSVLSRVPVIVLGKGKSWLSKGFLTSVNTDMAEEY